MMNLIKPFTVALKGKGPITLCKRIWTIGKRYGLTADRMDQSLEQLSQILHQFDCQATLPITAIALTRNNSIIQKYQAQGIEFAIHGYRHIDHSQLSLQEQKNYLCQADRIFQSHNINFTGFRCPYLRWNEHTLTALSQLNLTYDSSPSLAWNVIDDKQHITSTYSQALDFYGAQSASDYPALPYLDTVNNLVQIPYCLPDDEALIERLQWDSPNQMEQVWARMFCQIYEKGELFTLGLHPERTVECKNALIAALQEVQAVASTVWRTNLSEIAAWWQARYNVKIETANIQSDILQITLNELNGTTLLLRSLDTKTATKPWFDGYQLANEIPCIIQTNKRPFIGISPDSPAALSSFLKQQGYIVEISTNPNLYSFYLDRKSFSRQEQRPLMTQIEMADFPLVRLGRWPNGTRSALCITGDIDALTIWDYGLRFIGS